jgi:pimeloyl-ACP methyl ester carboxylesterase
MRPLLRSAILAVFAILGTAACNAQAAPAFQFRFTEKPGPYAVGLKVVDQYDRSRVFQNASEDPAKPASEGPRPLQILVWYPAEASTAQTMTIGNYAELIWTETSFDKPVKQGKSQSFVEDFTRGTTSLSMWAVRDAAMQSGKFPIVIYAPSLNAPSIENIEFCEYLASHGFVVLASPDMGATTREMTSDVAGANAGAKDISFLIDFAKTLPDTDNSAVAVIGYSWGGMSALFAAARDPRINALVSLDGSFRYAPSLVQPAGDVHPEQMLIPLLVFSRAEESLESWDKSHQNKDQFSIAPNVLNQWTRGDLLHVQMLAMSHIQFSSMFQRSQRFQKEGSHFAPADYSLEEGAVSYNWVAQYILKFLGAYLKHDSADAAFLKRTPAENGVPKHLISVSFRPASDPSKHDAPSPNPSTPAK